MKLVGFNATIRKKKVRVYVNPEFIQVIESIGDNCIIHFNHGKAILVEGVSAESAIDLITKSEPLWFNPTTLLQNAVNCPS